MQTILSYPALAGYAKSNPIEYESLITNSLELAKQWFQEPRKAEEINIIRQLEAAQVIGKS